MATDMFYGASSTLFKRAEELRATMTLAEITLWGHLRINKLKGYRFKNQHSINYFIADFYCHKARLVIEVDGSVHDSGDQIEYDTNRTYILEEFGITVIRFRNEEVLNCIDKVLNRITSYLP
ncbi:MAG: DUF559 domain-containing protein [Cytophagaceae bacterium]|nr:MAG: DUF559 domain-containing protein [Cytophagaceae bacterium]